MRGTLDPKTWDKLKPAERNQSEQKERDAGTAATPRIPTREELNEALNRL